MTSKATTIPTWYKTDWQAATGRGEHPVMTWDAIETTIETVLPTSAHRNAAQTLFRGLWMQGSQMDSMDLLQAILMTSAVAFDPTRQIRQEAGPTIPTRASGLLPRWSYTDLEVALSYTWTGTAQAIVLERHHDLLGYRGEDPSPLLAVRRLILMVSGLPVRPARVQGLKESGRSTEVKALAA